MCTKLALEYAQSCCRRAYAHVFIPKNMHEWKIEFLQPFITNADCAAESFLSHHPLTYMFSLCCCSSFVMCFRSRRKICLRSSSSSLSSALFFLWLNRFSIPKDELFIHLVAIVRCCSWNWWLHSNTRFGNSRISLSLSLSLSPGPLSFPFHFCSFPFGLFPLLVILVFFLCLLILMVQNLSNLVACIKWALVFNQPSKQPSL